MSRKRPRYITLWIPLFLAVIFYSFGDVLLKQGNMDLGSTIESLLQGSFWIALFLSLPVIIAFALTFASKMIMGIVLSKNDLGVSEGLFLALSVGILSILGVIFFNETANRFQILGLILLIVGILLVSDREDYIPVPIIEDPEPEQE
jgi:multidrug transporter EmrE-like cation transporter